MKKALFTIIMCIALVNNVLAFEMEDQVAIYGFASQGYMKTTTNNYLVDSEEGSYQLREMVITFSSQIASNFRVGAQFAAVDVGTVGNNEPVLDWAYGDYRFNEYVGFRAGRTKASLGLYNETKDIDAVRNSIFLPNAVYHPLLRDSLLSFDNIALYGDFPIHDYLGSFSYQFSSGTTSLAKDGATNKYIESI
ncbi:MAG: hypothetical protein HQK77_02515, partial [Desulfobacterales bacterium]|nr:hypothetical protein [Desulfobacterales bacterium]